MGTFAIAVGLVIALATMFVVFVSIAALRAWRDRPSLLIAAMFGWLAIASLLVFTTRTRIPSQVDRFFSSSAELAENTDTSLTSADTMATDTMATDTDALAAFDAAVAEGTYRSLIEIRDNKIERKSYEALGSVRKTLLKLRLSEAEARGDRVARQVLADISAWETSERR